jgi:menaquinol-cytochrome c reductase cytochrome b/c subunit
MSEAKRVTPPGLSSEKGFIAAFDSDSRKTPLRVAFVTRRTSPQVKARDDESVMTFPEALFRGMVAVEILALVLVVLALVWNAPLEELADPLQTPNPAKAPWYFLGLQELLHYFPPVVAGVLIPGMVVMALIVIPYFKINIEAEGLWTRNRAQRLRIVAVVTLAFAAFLVVFDVWAVLIPTLLVAGLMFFSATNPPVPGRFHRWLAAKPLSFWIMSWFLVQAAVLTLIGTFFRGPGWSLVAPWSGQI